MINKLREIDAELKALGEKLVKEVFFETDSVFVEIKTGGVSISTSLNTYEFMITPSNTIQALVSINEVPLKEKKLTVEQLHEYCIELSVDKKFISSKSEKIEEWIKVNIIGEKNVTASKEEKTITLSTEHIKEKDGELLTKIDKQREQIAYLYPDEYGAFVVIPNKLELAEALESFKKKGFTNAFTDLIEFANKNDYRYIRLDSDAEVVKGLKTYDW